MAILEKRLVLTTNGREERAIVNGREWGEWADAIACRVADESGYEYEDKKALEKVLSKALRSCPDEGAALVGTSIIEEGYFDE
jgi:hypothetical protein